MQNPLKRKGGVSGQQLLMERCSGIEGRRSVRLCCPDREQSRGHTTCKERIRFDKVRRVKIQPMGEYTNMFLYVSFWCASNSHLLQNYEKFLK